MEHIRDVVEREIGVTDVQSVCTSKVWLIKWPMTSVYLWLVFIRSYAG